MTPAERGAVAIVSRLCGHAGYIVTGSKFGIMFGIRHAGVRCPSRAHKK